MRPLLSLDQLARLALERGASDFHLAAGLPPVLFVLGNLVPTEFNRMSPEHIEALVRLDEPQQELYRSQGQLTFSYCLDGELSGRLHILRQREAMNVSARIHPWQPPRIDSSPLEWGRGLWIVAGSGRSTLQCAVVHQLSAGGRSLAVDQAWQEWPWEFPALSKYSPRDAVVVLDDLIHPARLALACDLLAGGRDLLATHPGNGYAEVLAALEHHASGPRYTTLLERLGGIVCQRLVPHKSGQSLVPVREILVATPAMRNLLRDGKSIQIFNTVQTGSRYGMQTFDQALFWAAQEGAIDVRVAFDYADQPDDLKRMLKGG